MAEVEVIYYTDPGCPWSWAAEPVLRRIQAEFADSVAITYVMAGLAREISDPHEMLLSGLDAAAASGMPVDARGWGGRDGRAPRSTYPACLAVKAAQEQGAAIGTAYLRVLREGFWLRRGRLDSPDALEDAARLVPGLDAARFAIDLRSSAIAEAFGADLERARGLPLPSFDVAGTRVEGGATALRDAVLAAGATARPALPDPAELLRDGPATTAEVAAATGLPWPRAEHALWTLALAFAARPERIGGGVLWHAATWT
jgi:predicted DsbA family dithiol-disulfide isomerase